MLADRFPPNLSLTRSGVDRGLWIQKEANKKAMPGEGSGGRVGQGRLCDSSLLSRRLTLSQHDL